MLSFKWILQQVLARKTFSRWRTPFPPWFHVFLFVLMQSKLGWHNTVSFTTNSCWISIYWKAMFWSRLRICLIEVEKHTAGELWVLSAEWYFTEPAGGRAKGWVPQVLIAGWEFSNEVELPARKLSSRGISLYVVWIGVQNSSWVSTSSQQACISV